MQEKMDYSAPECIIIELRLEGVIANSLISEGVDWGGGY